MEIYVSLNEEGIIEEWSSTPAFKEEIKVDIDRNHPFFNTSSSSFLLKDGKIEKSEEEELRAAKEKKDKELNEICKENILKGFYFTINGIEYHFSFDVDAQLNFQGAERLFATDSIETLTWTVTKDGVYDRIEIDKKIMEELSLRILDHKSMNISKYRDTLLPMVNNATTIEEVQSIVWESA